MGWGTVIVAIIRHVFKRFFMRLAVVVAISAMYVCLLPSAVNAQPDHPNSPQTANPAPSAPTPTATTGNLNGVYVLLGVAVAATRLDSEWDSTAGGHLTVAHNRESRAATLMGIDIGLSQFGALAGGRAWVSPVVGTRAFGPLVGLSAGVTARWDRTLPPKWGGFASAWIFAGVVPYVTVGRLEDVGTFVEGGLRLTLPALRLGRH